MFSNPFILGSITPIKIFRLLLNQSTFGKIPFIGEKKKKKKNNNNKVQVVSLGGPSIPLKKLHPSAVPDALALTNVLQDSKTICWEDVVQRWVLHIWLVPTTTSIQQLNY
jgi:hypothetical protein